MTATADPEKILDGLGVPRPAGEVAQPPRPVETVANGDAAQGAGRRTWRPVDLAEVLDGRYEPPVPTIGRRADGAGLYYPGRAHTVAAEPEAGKTWFQLGVSASELAAGHGVVYIDFEDDEGGIVGRLLALGVRPDIIRDLFAYIRPESPIDDVGRGDLGQALGDLRPSLVTLDGVTEGMALHGLDPLKNHEVAAFGRQVVRPITECGAAVSSLDHVVKDPENRGRYALGAGHKLAGLNGAAYALENREPFGVGRTGRSGLYVNKDRPGQLRRNAVKSKQGKFWLADLEVASHRAGFVEASLAVPVEQSGAFRPTGFMAKVSEALARAGQPLSVRGILDRVDGRGETIRRALACLVDEGYVTQSKTGNTHLHSLAKPFEDDTARWLGSLPESSQ
jgi:hypothetical protein